MHPILFHVGPLPVFGYGVMLGLSLVVGWFLALGLATRDGLPREPMASCYIVTAAAALVGARLLFVVTNLSLFRSPGDLLALRDGGLVAYGGFLGGLAGSALYCRLRGLPLRLWGDAAVPALASGLALTRIGCFLYGCDFGRVTGAWVGVRFPPGSPAFRWHQQRLAGEMVGAVASLPVHPTQLYESALGLLLLAALLALRPRRRFAGQLFLTFALAYGAARFLLELLRDDPQRGGLGPLSTSQLIAVGTVGAAAAAYVALSRAARRDPAAARAWEHPVAPPARAPLRAGARRRRGRR